MDGPIQGCVVDGIEMPIASKWLGQEQRTCQSGWADSKLCGGRYRIAHDQQVTGAGGIGHARVDGPIQGCVVEGIEPPIASKWLGRRQSTCQSGRADSRLCGGRYRTAHCQQVAGEGGKEHARVDGPIQGFVVEGFELPIASKWLGQEATDMPEYLGRFKLCGGRYRTAHDQQVTGAGGKGHVRVDGPVQGCVVEGMELPIASK